MSFMRLQADRQTFRGTEVLSLSVSLSVFYELLGIVHFHLRAIKGLHSLETPTAWG